MYVEGEVGALPILYHVRISVGVLQTTPSSVHFRSLERSRGGSGWSGGNPERRDRSTHPTRMDSTVDLKTKSRLELGWTIETGLGTRKDSPGVERNVTPWVRDDPGRFRVGTYKKRNRRRLCHKNWMSPNPSSTESSNGSDHWKWRSLTLTVLSFSVLTTGFDPVRPGSYNRPWAFVNKLFYLLSRNIFHDVSRVRVV